MGAIQWIDSSYSVLPATISIKAAECGDRKALGPLAGSIFLNFRSPSLTPTD